MSPPPEPGSKNLLHIDIPICWIRISFSGGSPGIVVMGGGSCSKRHEFESRYRILDGHDIIHIYLPQMHESNGLWWMFFTSFRYIICYSFLQSDPVKSQRSVSAASEVRPRQNLHPRTKTRPSEKISSCKMEWSLFDVRRY